MLFILLSLSVCLTLEGNKVANAGKTVTENTNAAVTPIAAIFPKSLKGGASLKLSDKKPIAVVIEVKKIGPKLIRRLSTIAAFFSIPLRICCIHVERICTQSATASVRIITGEDITGGDN